MKKMIIIIAFAVILNIAWIYCDGNSGKGSLSVKFDLAQLTLPVKSYGISLISFDGKHKYIESSSLNTEIPDLIQGEWDISITAKNTDDLPVGSAAARIMIKPGKTTKKDITISAFSNTGSFKIGVIWDSLIESAYLKCNLNQSIGSMDSINFTINNGTDTFDNIKIPAGYYILSIKFIEKGVEQSGAVELIKISPDSPSEALIKVTASQGNNCPCMEIVHPKNDYLGVNLRGMKHTLNHGESIVVTAKNNSKNAIYSWFIDGILKKTGPELKTFVLPENLQKGRHRLDITLFTIDERNGGNTNYSFEVL